MYQKLMVTNKTYGKSTKNIIHVAFNRRKIHAARIKSREGERTLERYIVPNSLSNPPVLRSHTP